MKDPFEILGVSRDATEEQIKDAYRKLAQKYHPDNYSSSPLGDLAAEKMVEINQAYDEVIRIIREQEASAAQYQAGPSGPGYQSGPQGDSQFSDIRTLINSGRFVDAEELLNGVPPAARDAEWHFLKGTVFYSKGYLDDAYTLFQTAVNMNPSNPEYTAAFNNLKWQRTGNMQGNPYGGYRQTQSNMGCSVCDVCTGLLVADCCCECMGGDLIGCC